MITPRFSCSQTEESVIVSLYCPSIRAADVEINVDETLVTIHVNPYFLRLNFSKPVLEDDNSSADYDPSAGNLTVALTKETKGETFEDLDLLAKLLAPRRSTQNHTPLIEVLSSSKSDPDGDLVSRAEALSLNNEEMEEAAENDWQIPQEVPTVSPLRVSLQAFYGFLDMYSGYLRHAAHTENEVNELGGDSEVCSKAERREKRVKHEFEKFDEEHYMADFMDDEYIKELIAWDDPLVGDENPVQYTDEEKMTMLRLPRKEYLATDVQTHNIYLVLATFLFSFVYDSRTTQHDPTSESAWTICNLTPAFSALDPPQSSYYKKGPHIFTPEELEETVVPSYRRCLTFPLYRSFNLAEKCWEDVARILNKGKRFVMRCLLEMKKILDHHDVYYVYSKIWLDDICVWIQTDGEDDVLQLLGQNLLVFKIRKSSLELDLEDLERAAMETLEREADSDDENSD